jgi:hypothetical protein
MMWTAKKRVLSVVRYSGRKITENLGNIAVREEKDGKRKRGV